METANWSEQQYYAVLEYFRRHIDTFDDLRFRNLVASGYSDEAMEIALVESARYIEWTKRECVEYAKESIKFGSLVIGAQLVLAKHAVA